jgi:50S ribosomal protein L16 3-hydroxylase
MSARVPPASFFGAVSTDEFLTSYWKKKPLMVRGAWPGFTSPLSVTQLFALAERDDAECRLILERGGAYPWEALFGPFDAGELEALPATHWTLLIQELDRLVPETARLLDALPFLPNWRFDDVMVSYAVDKGGVGAHIDEYDVFLLQGLGRRKWSIDSTPVEEEALIPDLDVRMLANFRPTEAWILQPGDMLYLPPRIAHHGVAEGPCMTYSIGCRAPSEADILSAFLQDRLETASEVPFSDAGTDEGKTPGSVHESVKQFARATLHAALGSDLELNRWLGRYLSRSSRGYLPEEPENAMTREGLILRLRKGDRLRTMAVSQLLYDILSDGRVAVYAGGEEYLLDAGLERAVEQLTGRQGFAVASGDDLPDAFVDLALELVNAGFLVFSD